MEARQRLADLTVKAAELRRMAEAAEARGDDEAAKAYRAEADDVDTTRRRVWAGTR